MRENYLIDGKYRILKVLGKGGMSTVYLAENIKLGTLWAVKEISKAANTQIDMLVEPNILKRLNHPALPRVFDIIENEESIFIIVDYIDGKSLDRELDEWGCFPEETALNWAKQLCEVLEYLHGFNPNPIIYRDMKPSNIILTKDGGVKLIDFGIAREYKEDLENDTVYIGTRGYASPEQYGFGQTNMTSDIYSLGITLFHIVTGKNPNQLPEGVKPVRHYNNELSADIEQVILKCTKHNAEDRYQTAKELLDDLEFIINKGKNSRSSALLGNRAMKVPEDYKKVAGFVGDRAAGTTILITAISEFFSSKNKNVGIIDLTRNCKLYSMHGINRDEAEQEGKEYCGNSLMSLMEDTLKPIKLDKRRSLFSSEEYIPIDHSSYMSMLEKVREGNDVVLVDMSFDTDREIIRYLDHLYIVKDMDMYCIKNTSDYLRTLKNHKINLTKSKFIINKYVKTSIKAKAIVDTIISYACRESFLDTGFFKDRRPDFFTVPFDLENYKLAVESINRIQFSCSGFSPGFKRSIQEIAENIYPPMDGSDPDKGFLNIFSKLKESRKDVH